MATGAKLTLNVSTVEVKSLRGIVETICTQGEPSGQALKSHLESFPLSDKEEDGTALMCLVTYASSLRAQARIQRRSHLRCIEAPRGSMW